MSLWNLDYYVLGEFITCVLTFILSCNIFLSFSFYDKRQRFFGYAVISTFFSALFDISSAFCITYADKIPTWMGTLSSTLFYIFLIATPFFICCYAIEIAYAYRDSKRRSMFTLCVVIGVAYFVIIIVNLFTGIVFRHDKELGYVHGKLGYITYLMTGIYACITVFSVIVNKKSMAKRMFWVFVAYPFISCIFVGVQFNNPKILLTGISSFTALLFAYIFIQSDLLEYDTATGLMNENKLRKQINQKKQKGAVYVFYIENMKLLQNNMDISKLNMLMLDIGKEFSNVFDRSAFHISTSRFAAIGKKIDFVVEKGNKIERYIRNLVNKPDLGLPTAINFHSAVANLADYDFTYSTLTDVINAMLKKAKNNDFRNVQVCDESIIKDIENRHHIYAVLKDVLENDSSRLKMWYQPIYSFKEKKYTHLEALARINGTEIGDISPVDFISVAESKGLISPLGEIIFEKVCRFISENNTVVDTVAVNFSIFQLINSDFVDKVVSILSKYNLKPSNIIMEVKEDIFIDDYYYIILENMTKLSDLGIQFHLDNFGTGKSNVEKFIKLPFNTVKFDITLTKMAELSKNEDSLFSGMAATFKNAKFSVIAEGVETRNQLILANKAGVDYVQGFISGPPMPGDKIIDFLKRKNV